MTIAQLSSVDNANCGFLVIFIFETDILGVMHDFCLLNIILKLTRVKTWKDFFRF